MKARVLKSLLDDTDYIISNHEEYIAVGSDLCHDLLKVDKKSFKISYALDTWKEGRISLVNKFELLSIWDKLQELIDSGKIHDIINGKDIIENPLPVFTIRDGKIHQSVTDKYGYPNTDEDGYCLYSNTHFKTEKEAIEYGIEELEHTIKVYSKKVKNLEMELAKSKENLDKQIKNLESIKQLKQ